MSALNWIRAAVIEHQWVKTNGAAKMIILRRVGILKELIARSKPERDINTVHQKQG